MLRFQIFFRIFSLFFINFFIHIILEMFVFQIVKKGIRNKTFHKLESFISYIVFKL